MATKSAKNRTVKTKKGLLKFLEDNNFRLGFEVECLMEIPKNCKPLAHKARYGALSNAEYTQFSRSIDNRWMEFCRKLMNLGVIIGHDGSIRHYGFTPYARTAELRTNPLPPKQAMELLKQVLDIVNEYGGTNRSCGFHVNLSSTKKGEMKKFNPFIFLGSDIWQQLLKDFNRDNNRFCRLKNHAAANKRFSKVTILQKAANEIFHNKYSCVNFNHFGTGEQKGSRIEIRGFGNKNYQRRYDLIARYIDQIHTLFKSSCDDRKKLIPLLGV